MKGFTKQTQPTELNQSNQSNQINQDTKDTQLQQLNTIANSALSGLTAGQELKYRILHAAKEQPNKTKRRYSKTMMAMAGSLVIVFSLGIVFIPQLINKPQSDPENQTLFNHMAAGGGIENNTDMTSENSNNRAMLDMPPGSLSLTAGNTAPKFNSLWESGSGSNFPLVGIDGKYYRLMNRPTSINDDMLGMNLGTIGEYTQEPALACTDGIISNIVSQGEAIYAISGMDGAVIAAPIDGKMRAFQRVSFGNSAIIGSESLKDTLKSGTMVEGIQLSGVGTITDSETASMLVNILFDNATFSSAAASTNDKQNLLISLSNGIALQLIIKDDTLSACGSWSCPEFFEAFNEALSK